LARSLIIRKRDFDAVIFDLDGVVTRTARVHAAAWKKLFDAFLAGREGEDFEPFSVEKDYLLYVDGRPRYEGVKSFLGSRGIELPFGESGEEPGWKTVCGLGNMKNRFFREHLQEEGVDVYPDTLDLLRSLGERGFATAIISSSRNCLDVLAAAGVEGLVDAVVDGNDSARLGLSGKPAPDVFLEAARRLEVDPRRAVVVEDALAGVEAGRRGGFGCVIGVDRSGQAEALREQGADRVVRGLGEVTVAGAGERPSDELSSALENAAEIARCAMNGRLAVFLDYDGTLTPIVDRPERAYFPEAAREAVRNLAELCTVAVVSGRDLQDVRRLVGIEEIFYAGSHGFDIAGPQGWHLDYQQGIEYLPSLDLAEEELKRQLENLEGVLVERKRFAVAVHFRRVAEERRREVEAAFDEVLGGHSNLRKSGGKMIFELRPDIDWDKGKAVSWLLAQLGLEGPGVLPLYLGDDLTDEDAFRELRRRGEGLGIVVREELRVTAAHYALEHTGEVRQFLQALAKVMKEQVR
jgi:trehalose 6-phosphate phosphatase